MNLSDYNRVLIRSSIYDVLIEAYGSHYMSKINKLMKLQHYDNALESIGDELKALEKKLSKNERLEAVQKQLAEISEEKASHIKKMQAVEIKTSEMGDRIKKEEEQLYDGTITNAKDLENLQNEIKRHKNLYSSFEDEELELLSVLEELDATILTISTEEEKERSEWERISQELKSTITSLENNSTLIKVAKEIDSDTLDNETVKDYEELRTRKDGVAVTHIQGNTCVSCYLSIPDALKRRITTAENTNYCPNCKRIIAPQLQCTHKGCIEIGALQINQTAAEFRCTQHAI